MIVARGVSRLMLERRVKEAWTFLLNAPKDPWLPKKKKWHFVRRFLEDVIEITKCEIYT